MTKTPLLLLAAALFSTAAASLAADATATATDPAFCPHDEVAPVVDPRTTQLVHGARTGDAAAVAQALKDGTGIESVDALDQTALIAAITQGKLAIVQQLIAAGADVNHGDHAGWSPLHFAVFFSTDTALLDALLAKGARINAQNDRGITPLYFASITGHDGQVQRLLAAGADASIASRTGYTPLRVARIKGLTHTATLLDGGAKAGSGS